jgi:hypothetical protein
MDRNAYRDDNGADQLRNHPDQLRTPLDQREPYPDQREPYPNEHEPYPSEPEPYPDQPDTYWRRRAATMAAGLGVLGLLAWAFSGGGGKPAPAPHNSPAAAATYPSGPASGSGSGSPAASGSASPSAGAGADAAVPGLGSPGTSGLPSATSGPKAKPSKSTASARSTASAKAAQAAVNTEPGGRCSPSSVVLSLFSGSRTYPSGQNPQFDVNVVSTAAGTCTFDLSPAQLHVVVMSAGRVIWDSADCARGDGTQLRKLARGVPVQDYFTWNRAITLPGCVTLASSARPGSYQAQARTPAISSGTFSFKLVR